VRCARGGSGGGAAFSAGARTCAAGGEGARQALTSSPVAPPRAADRPGVACLRRRRLRRIGSDAGVAPRLQDEVGALGESWNRPVSLWGTIRASTDAPVLAVPWAAAEGPQFFVVGHHKCVTSAMYEMLRRHPQIYMPGSGDVYFSPERRSVRKNDRRSTSETSSNIFHCYDRRVPDSVSGELAGLSDVQAGAARRIGERNRMRDHRDPARAPSF